VTSQARSVEAAQMTPARRVPPVLLAERQGVVFVATSASGETLRVPPRHWGTDTSVVTIPAQEDEIASCELVSPSDGDDWPRALPRPDLLAPALSRMLSREHVELSLHPGRDGAKATLIAADGRRHPFPIAPKDAIGLLAALFHNAPRGVVSIGPTRPEGILLAVRPAPRPQEYRLRVAGVVASPPPRSLQELGLSPSLSEVIGEALDKPSGLLLVAAGSSSGRSTTLEVMAEGIKARGRRGGRVGARPRLADPNLPWLADSVADWPFPESLKEAASDFVVVDRLDGPRQLLLAARLAGSGTLVLAGAPPADPLAILRRVEREIEAASGPNVPVMILAQALVRSVCVACRTWKTIPAALGIRLGFHRSDLEEMERRAGLRVPSGRGCGSCAGTGFGGLTGVFSYASSDGMAGGLPALREEGWRKVAEGTAGHEDVLALPGSRHALRSLREVAVLAGVTLAPSLETANRHAHEPLEERSPREASEAIPRPAEPSPSPEDDVAALLDLFRAAQAGRPPQPDRIDDLARGIAGRAALTDLAALIVGPPGRYHLARHSVNTALLSARIVAALGQGEDAPATATLGLLHDAGLLEAGLDPGADLPAIDLEAAIDPEGRRLRPQPILTALGVGGSEMAEWVADVQELLDARSGAVERGRADLRCQAVALASLIELTYNASPAASADLHEVSSVVMARHGQRFSPLLFRALLRAIPIFPTGCYVELSSGDVARVVAQNDDNHFRPRVEITSGGSAAKRRVVDLARAPFLHIRHRLPGGASEVRP
jgi:hypothetical protein